MCYRTIVLEFDGDEVARTVLPEMSAPADGGPEIRPRSAMSAQRLYLAFQSYDLQTGVASTGCNCHVAEQLLS